MIAAAESTLQERVASLVDDLLGEGPCFAVDVVVRGSQGSHAVDVFIESDDALTVFALGRVSRELGYVMDVHDVMPGPYRLNVSSPGANRPLKVPRQYRKMVGRDLRVHFRRPDGRNTEVVGRLEMADAERIHIRGPKGSQSISYQEILWAKVALPW